MTPAAISQLLGRLSCNSLRKLVLRSLTCKQHNRTRCRQTHLFHCTAFAFGAFRSLNGLLTLQLLSPSEKQGFSPSGWKYDSENPLPETLSGKKMRQMEGKHKPSHFLNALTNFQKHLLEHVKCMLKWCPAAGRAQISSAFTTELPYLASSSNRLLLLKKKCKKNNRKSVFGHLLIQTWRQVGFF